MHHTLLRTIVLLLIAICAACSSQKTIVNGLDEKEANEILVFLASKNIQAVKVVSKEGQGAGGGAAKASLWDISVDAPQANEAMAILNANGLPRRRGQQLLDIFASGGLVPSEMQEQIRYQSGLAEQIASTIRKIDGVLDADVQLSFPKEDVLNPNAPKGKVTASVYVKHNGVLDDPNSHLVTKIQRLVAGSVNGLTMDNVTVIGDRARFAEAIPSQIKSSAQLNYVEVWGVVVSSTSLTRFQVLFFTFCFIILLLVLVLVWVGWKFFPVLHKCGGVKLLFHMKPIEVMPVAPKEEAPKEGEPPKDKPPEAGKGPDKPATPAAPKVQENVEGG